MITSFCMSWISSAVRCGSIVKSAISPPMSARTCQAEAWHEILPMVRPVVSLHERLAATRDPGHEPVDGRRRRHEHPLPLGPAPVQIADALGDLDDAEVLAAGREDPDACGAGHPDVAAFVRLHPVDEAALREVAVADPLGEHAVV